MDGNIFFTNRFDSSQEAIINFDFNLQRFADPEYVETLTDDNKATYIYEAKGTGVNSTVKYYRSLTNAETYAGEDGTIAMTTAPTSDADKAAFLYEARPGDVKTVGAVKYYKTFAAAETYANTSHNGNGVGDDLSYVAYLATDQATAISEGYTVSAKVGESGTTKYFNDIRYAFDYVKNGATTGTPTASTIDVLADISDAKGIAARDTSTEHVNTTINLHGHTLTFVSAVIANVNRSKAMQLEMGSNVTINGGDGTENDTTVGTITIVPQDLNGKFERIIKCYCDVTINNVTLDATNLLQGAGMDDAAIQTSYGKLSLKGNTSVIVKDDDSTGTYYAITGAKAATGSYENGFQIEIDTTSETPIKNIALATWGNSETVKVSEYTYKSSDSTDTSTSVLVIKQGNIQDLAVSELTNETTTNTTTGETVVTKTLLSSTNSSDDSTPAVQILPTEEGQTVTIGETTYTKADVNTTTGKVTTTEKQAVAVSIPGSDSGADKVLTPGWNDGSFSKENRWFYVAKEGDTAQVVITADGVSDSTAFGGVDTTNKVAAIPANIDTSVTADSGYHVVKTNYYSNKKRVAFSFDAQVTIRADSLFADTVETLDSSGNVAGASIVGNSLANEIRGGRGDSLFGGVGNDVFVYSGGNNLISDYATGDSIRVSGIALVTDGDKLTKTGNDFEIDFGEEGALSITGGATLTNGVTVLAGSDKTPYLYRSDFISHGTEGITLTPDYAEDPIVEGASTVGYAFQDINNYEAINAAAFNKAISIEGDHHNNTITGSSKHVSSIHGGSGNDLLIGSSVTSDVFKYTMGKDTIENYQYGETVGEGDDATTATDTLVIDTSKIKSAKAGKNKFAIKVDNKNSLTFKTEEYGIEKIALQDGGFIIEKGTTSNGKFTLFEGARGKIDLVEDTIYGGSSVASIDASASKSPVTLIATDSIEAVTFGTNKKKDQFDFAGGTVSITGYESGKDKLNIANVGAVSLFSVDTTGVSINAGGSNVISIQGAADKEVMIRDGVKGNSYSKYVFHETGVLYNKAKKPTEAKIYSNVVHNNNDGAEVAVTVDSSIKKVFLQEGVAGVSIQSSNNKTTLDASAAGSSVSGSAISLIGGAKNNRFVGSDYGDMFVYNGGKDIVDDFQIGGTVSDSISFDTGTYQIEDAKISVSKKSLKLKFSSKNALNLKSNDTISSLKVGDTSYTFAKNAFSTGTGSGTVSLTSAFSGSYKIGKNNSATTVDGSLVKKNLTFKGTSAAETLSGGTKKTTFKGGGGNDSLIGGTGKDVFFYAKGDKGNTTIADFDVKNDKVKIASGTITDISTVSGGIKFDMNSGRKGSANIGSFTVASSLGGGAIDTTKTLIKTGNTYYWFADNDTASKTDGVNVGDLITADTKVSKSNATSTGYAILDLGYSTNLVKAGVATKAGEFNFNGGITKK